MMKQTSLIFGAFMILLSGTAFAQNNAVGKALDSYAKVAGAWYLNQKCGYLEAKDMISSFENSVAVITTALRNELGDEKILRLIQKSAKDTIDSGKYGSCEETRSLFISGFAHAINWSTQIRRIQQKQG